MRTDCIVKLSKLQISELNTLVQKETNGDVEGNLLLRTKTEYFATLQPAVPSQEDGSRCTICRDPEWHYPEEEVVQAGP
jgi:hypothetical protein